MNLSARDQKVIWHPFSPLLGSPALPIASAKGALLFDVHGKSYIDAISSWWTNLHGHANPFIADRIAGQAKQLEQVIFAGFTHEPAVLLAENLLAILPGDFERVFFSDNGSTAVEVALKMAAQYWSNRGQAKTRFIALENGYHGDTVGAMSASARGVFNAPFSPLLFDVARIPVPNAQNLSEVLNVLEAEYSRGDIAAFIFEPLLQGAGGMNMYDAEALSAIVQRCNELEIVTIADEVLTGFGRTGSNFAMERVNQAVDLVCLSKGVTGDFMPLGVTACSPRICSAFETEDRRKMFLHGHSYTANPLACAAAVASLELLTASECVDQRQRIENSHAQFAQAIQSHPKVSKARALGTIMAFDLVEEKTSGYMGTAGPKLGRWFVEQGVLLRPLGNVIYILPPYCITNAQLARVYEVIAEVLSIGE